MAKNNISIEFSFDMPKHFIYVAIWASKRNKSARICNQSVLPMWFSEKKGDILITHYSMN